MSTILLSGCNSIDKSVIVPTNLDYLALKDDEVAFPSELIGSEFDLLVETKQDFVLYFYAKSCAGCKIVGPYYDQLLNPKNGGNPYNIYSFNANSADFSWISSRYPNLFDVTPKTMFFKNGQNILTLSSSRYKSYKIFESAMDQFVLNSKIYTGTKTEAIKGFMKDYNNEEYLLYLRSNKKENNQYIGFTYWSNNVYPIVKNSEIPTLLLTYETLDSEMKKTINETYGLTNSNIAIYIEKYSYTVYDYTNKTQSDSLLKLLKERF